MFYRTGYRVIDGKTFAIVWGLDGKELGRKECPDEPEWLSWIKANKDKFVKSGTPDIYSKTFEVKLMGDIK